MVTRKHLNLIETTLIPNNRAVAKESHQIIIKIYSLEFFESSNWKTHLSLITSTNQDFRNRYHRTDLTSTKWITHTKITNYTLEGIIGKGTPRLHEHISQQSIS